jgi:hypothetical protein
VKTMLAQHCKIRRLIERVAAPHRERGDYARLVGELGRQLDEHIRHEERVVFAQMQHRMTDAQLNALPRPPEALRPGCGVPQPAGPSGRTSPGLIPTPSSWLSDRIRPCTSCHL